MSSLEKKLAEILDANITEQTLTFSQSEHHIISQIHDMAEILATSYESDSITIRFRLDKIHSDRLKKVLGQRPKSA